VHAEQVGQDGGGKVGGESAVAGCPDFDAVAGESSGQGVVGDRLAGDKAGKQLAGASLVTRNGQASLRLGAQPPQKRRQPGR
jgi:hypothetical protein